jgi:hypothetical protein
MAYYDILRPLAFIPLMLTTRPGITILLLATCSHAGFLLSLFFDPENEDGMFLRNVG